MNQENEEKPGFWPAFAIHAGAVLLVAAVVCGAVALLIKATT